MGIRFLFFSMTAAAAIAASVETAQAEDRIQTFVNATGRVVYTNLIDDPPPAVATSPAVAPDSDDLIETPAWLRALVDAISANHGVDAALVRAVIKTESNFNRWATSSKGALGLMQLIPSTGHRYGVRDFFDPQQNIDGGVRYLKFLLQKFNGDLDLSLAAYNAGENLVERLGRIPPIPETVNYVRRVRAIYNKPSVPAIAAGEQAAVIATASPEPPKIFKTVDARGVIHFSNIEPPN
jgi:soluble lytic murein transglycosylase-like protein